MNEWIALIISSLALLVSAITAWLTLFRPGSLKMTQPTVIYLGPDRGSRNAGETGPKVYLRTLLYSTSKRGQTIESMHVSVQRGESRQNFSVWVYGNERLTRGSGLYVGEDGVAYNHHFLLPKDGANLSLLPGQYVVHVLAKRVKDRSPRELMKVTLSISDAQSKELENPDAGIYFDWGPAQQAYHSHVDIRKPRPLPDWLLDD